MNTTHKTRNRAAFIKRFTVGRSLNREDREIQNLTGVCVNSR
jgi:hypothetical protein